MFSAKTQKHEVEPKNTQGCPGVSVSLWSKKGFTLVEVMLAASITVILAMGALGYQYCSVAHSRSSEAEITATHIAQLLVEDWKSTNGDTAYDPTGLGLGFLATAPGDFGQYLITVDTKTFYAQLTQQLVPIANNPDTVAGVTLNQLTVTVRWRTDCSRGATTIDDPTLSLITYIRCDED